MYRSVQSQGGWRQPTFGRLSWMSRLRSCAYVLAGSVGFIFMSAHAYAEAALAAADTAPRAATGEQAGLEEIVVTARRRGEDIEKVPVSVIAFGQAQLEERSIRSEEDLQNSVPGLTIRAAANQNALNYSIRGQTIDIFTSSPSAVVPYINEVQANSGGASLFFDLDSIQVLKGPQGTLFGRNATGGAVLYTTVKPTNEFEGYLEGRSGNYDYHEGQGAINIPLVDDKVLLRVAFDVASRNGYVYNVYDNDHQGALRRQSGRVSLVVRPTDSITNTTVFEFDHAGGSNTSHVLYSANKCGTVDGYGVPLACSAALLYSPTIDQVFGAPGAWAAYLAAHPKAPPAGILAFAAQQRQWGPWTINQAGNFGHEENDYFVSNTTTFDLTSDTQIKNIFGATGSRQHDGDNAGGDPYGISVASSPAQSGNTDDVYSLSEELNLQGKALNQALTYIVGTYFQRTSTHIEYPQTFFDVSPIIPGGIADEDFKNYDKTEALYGQGTYNLGSLTGIEGLSFTGGFRYSWEEVRLVQLPRSSYFPAPAERVTFSNPSWQGGLEYQLTPELLAYVETRRSWRSGGFNGVAPPKLAPASEGGNLFFPEVVHDVEVGMKYGSTVYGHAFHLNLAAYNQWVDDIQRFISPVINGVSLATTFNVPAAEVTGLELDAAIKTTDWLEIGIAGALTDARFTKNTATVGSTTYHFGPYPDTPHTSGSVFARAILPTGDQVGEMSVRADLYAQTHTYFSSTDNSITPGTKIPGYSLINLRYDWNNIFRSSLSFGAYAKNLANRPYYVGGVGAGSSYGVNTAVPGVPRMYGAEIKYRFGNHGRN